MRPYHKLIFCVVSMGTFAACSSAGGPPISTSSASSVQGNQAEKAQKFPEITAVTATSKGDLWTFAVTISSPYDTPERYADGWRVTGPDGTVYGEHVLDHDHATEQPFTRTQPDVKIPASVDTVTIEGHDKTNGYGGKPFAIRLERP